MNEVQYLPYVWLVKNSTNDLHNTFSIIAAFVSHPNLMEWKNKESSVITYIKWPNHSCVVYIVECAQRMHYHYEKEKLLSGKFLYTLLTFSEILPLKPSHPENVPAAHQAPDAVKALPHSSAVTRRNNNVIITSKRRRDVVLT